MRTTLFASLMSALLFVAAPAAARSATKEASKEAPDATLSRTAPPVHHDLVSKKHKKRSRRKAKRHKKNARELSALLSLDAAGDAPLTAPASASPAPTSTPTAPSKAAVSVASTTTPASSSTPAPSASPRPLPLAATLQGGELAKAMVPLVILALFALALTTWRKRKHGVDAVKVLESTTIGKGRQILVVEVAGQHLLLGSCEGGISVLKDRVDLKRMQPQSSVVDDEVAGGHPAIDAVRRLLGLPSQQPPTTASFESHLTSEASSCVEDEELRRKLSARLNAA